jgi:hypothetical protein
MPITRAAAMHKSGIGNATGHNMPPLYTVVRRQPDARVTANYLCRPIWTALGTLKGRLSTMFLIGRSGTVFPRKIATSTEIGPLLPISWRNLRAPGVQR